MRILYLGNNVRGARCLETILEAGEQVAGVIAHPEPLRERPGESVKQIALDRGLPLLQPERINGAAARHWMVELEPDLGVLVGYNKILRQSVIDIPRLGCINLHGGKLPEYRGAAPINWQLINGDTTGGCCVLYVDAGIDTGDIISQERFPIGLDDDAASVLARTLEIFPPMLTDALAAIREGRVEREKQDPEVGCYYAKRYPQDGRIDWRFSTAKQVYDLVRALVPPYPGAFTYLGDEKVIVRRAALMSEEVRGAAGRVLLWRDDSAVVGTADRAVRIDLVESESLGQMAPRSFVGRLGVELT